MNLYNAPSFCRDCYYREGDYDEINEISFSYCRRNLFWPIDREKFLSCKFKKHMKTKSANDGGKGGAE